MVETPTNATITVSPAKRTRAPRTKRAPAPTAKVRENQAIKRTRRATRTETPPPLHFRNVGDSDSDYEDEDRDSSHTLEELLVLVKGLKNTTDQHNHAIMDAQTGSKELKEAQQIVKAQNTELQDEVQVNKAQRAWQERCASHGRTDPTAMQMFTEMQSKRRKWTRIIEKAKVSHWRDFLDQASSRTVWKATPYLERQNNCACIPALRVGDNEYADNVGKAQALMECFFTTTLQPSLEMIVAPNEIAWEPITKEEVASALHKAKKNTAPGQDGLPTVIWQELWPYVSTRIAQVFSASVSLGYYPTQWKTAKIVVLR